MLRGARLLLLSGQVRALQLEVSPFHLEKQNCTRAKITNILQSADFTCEFKCTSLCGAPNDQRSYGELVAWHNDMPRADARVPTSSRSKRRRGALNMNVGPLTRYAAMAAGSATSRTSAVE